jgi:hypothetical protein
MFLNKHCPGFFACRCEESPAIVVYDNGCNQENYCLAREPEFFGAVDFYVDASHWVTHTSCPPAYSSGGFGVGRGFGRHA